MPQDTYILFLYFIAYSIIGWVSEVIYCFQNDKVFVNRGFMHGPYCPIYGFGALMCIFLLSPFVYNPFTVFICAVILTSFLEYFTSFVIEKLFNTRLWDYSAKNFNLKGRICLNNSLLFGIGGLSVVYIFHPFITDVLSRLSENSTSILAMSIAMIFFADLITSVMVIINLNHHLAKIEETLTEIKRWPMMQIKELELAVDLPRITEIMSNLEILHQKLKKFRETKKWYHKRFLKAFPTLRSIKYPEHLNELKKRFNMIKEELTNSDKQNNRHIS